MEIQPGKRIKQLRSQQSLTLRELGEKANLSVSYLSLIERDLTSISLTALNSIAKALGVQKEDLMQEAHGTNQRVVRGYDLPVFRLSQSHYVYQCLHGEESAFPKTMEPVLVTVLPGQKRENVLPYPHEGEEFGFVLEGILTFLLENKSYDLGPGDSLHIPSRIPHNWANHTNKLVKMVYVSTSKVFD